jgi:hypothetical protein
VYRDYAEFNRQDHWSGSLPKKLHKFAGNYHSLPGKDPYRVEVMKDEKGIPCEQPKMAPPLSNLLSQPTFFNETSYSKHLIGMVRSRPSRHGRTNHNLNSDFDFPLHRLIRYQWWSYSCSLFSDSLRLDIMSIMTTRTLGPRTNEYTAFRHIKIFMKIEMKDFNLKYNMHRIY